MHIVLIATSWGSGEGGINAFNYSLAIGLAQVGRQHIQIYCALPSPPPEQIRDAEEHGITLIPVAPGPRACPTEACGHEVIAWFRSTGKNPPDLWIGHDVITGYAALAASKLSGRLVLIHHMAYLEYHNAKGGVGEKTLEKHESQRKLFSSENAIVFGVGPLLADDATNLGSQNVNVLVPGFPSSFTNNISDREKLRIIVAGRFDESSEALKQSKLAVAALARAVRKAGSFVRPLANPTMIIFGVSEERIAKIELEKLALVEAKRRINIVPGPFDTTPGRLIREMASSNLAIMPSFHEGFGLVGWEAIGCEVPLILGKDTGLYSFIEGLLGGRGTGCLKGLPISGGGLDASDVEAVSNAIVDIASNLQNAKRDANKLREQLEIEKGCTWQHCALTLLRDVHNAGAKVPGVIISPDEECPPDGIIDGTVVPSFKAVCQDYFPRCAELQISAVQGSRSNNFDVVAELRFGISPLQVDDLTAELHIKRAFLQVTSLGGKLRGERYGEGPSEVPGVEVLAGGVWILKDLRGGDMLKDLVLGSDTLCRIESPQGVPANVTLEITTARADVGCNIATSSETELSVTTLRVIEIFLKKALFKEESGHVLLSTATLRELGSNAK